MGLVVKNAERVFKLKRKSESDSITLPDPNINMALPDVQKFYASQYPELTSCTIIGPKMRDGKAQYEFQTIIGEKG